MKDLLKNVLVGIILSVLVISCKSSQSAVAQKPLAKHVILIGSDGFGAYAFENAKLPHLRKMMADGTYSLQARSVLPSPLMSPATGCSAVESVSFLNTVFQSDVV